MEPTLKESSSTGWYLTCNNLDTVSLAVLSGTQEGVSTESEQDFSTDGARWKVRLEAGAKAIDWRGLYWNYGA